MKNFIEVLFLVGIISGCATPHVHLVSPENKDQNGIRTAKVTPSEIIIMVVDDAGKLKVIERKLEGMTDTNQVYAVNYWGNFVTDSKFMLSLHPNGGLKNVHVETTRTLRNTAEAGKAVNERLLKAKKLEEEEKAKPQKELLEQIQAIKNYRTEYGAAIDLSAQPNEPLLPDGSSLPGK